LRPAFYFLLARTTIKIIIITTIATRKTPTPTPALKIPVAMLQEVRNEKNNASENSFMKFFMIFVFNGFFLLELIMKQKSPS